MEISRKPMSLEDTLLSIKDGDFPLPERFLHYGPSYEPYFRELLKRNASRLSPALFAEMQARYLSRKPDSILDANNMEWMHFVVQNIIARSTIAKMKILAREEFEYLEVQEPKNIEDALNLLAVVSRLDYTQNTLVVALHFHQDTNTQHPALQHILHTQFEMQFVEDLLAFKKMEEAREAYAEASARIQAPAPSVQASPRRPNGQATREDAKRFGMIMLFTGLIAIASQLYHNIKANVAKMPLFSPFNSSQEK